MKRHPEKGSIKPGYSFIKKTVRTTSLSKTTALLLGCILLIFFSKCQRNTDLPDYEAASKQKMAVAIPQVRAITRNFFGINAWMYDIPNPTSGIPVGAGGQLSVKWTDVAGSGAKFIRIGGIGYDKSLQYADDFLGILNDVRTNITNATPIVQLSYYDSTTGLVWTDPVLAANHLLNNVVIPLYYDEDVTYFSIANEPNTNGDYETLNNNNPPVAHDIYEYIKAFHDAKEALVNTTHPELVNIRLLGPELSYYDEPLIEELTDPLGQSYILPYIDYFTFHYYPFGNEYYDLQNPPSQDHAVPTWENITNIVRVGDPVYKRNTQRVNSLERNLRHLKGRISASQNADVKIAITEANICSQNYATSSVADGIDGADLNGNGLPDDDYYGANSYIAGQLWAETMAVCMANGVDFVNFWSIIEGSPSYKFGATDIGYISSLTGNFKSTYYHFQMLANHFQGDFKWAAITADSAVTHKIKAFATKQNSNKIMIMIMNQDQDETNTIRVKVRLDNNANIPSGGVLINVSDAVGINAGWQRDMPGQSTLVLKYNIQSGAFTQVLKYNRQDNVNNNAPH